MNFTKVLLMLICSVGLLSCQQPDKFRDEITVLENLLVEKTKEIDRLKEEDRQAINDLDGQLVHIVFFNLKNNLEEKQINQIVEEIERLRQISVVKNISYGDFIEVGDERSMKHLELVVQMVFNNVNDLKKYQSDTIHLSAKKKLKPFLETAPVTYDYAVVK